MLPKLTDFLKSLINTLLFRGCKTLGLSILFVIVLIYLTVLQHKIIIHNSDNAIIIEAAFDFLRGNWILKGWIFSSASFYFTDVIPAATLIYFNVPGKVVMDVLPLLQASLIYLLILSLILIRVNGEKHIQLSTALIFAVLFMASSNWLMHYLLWAPAHNGTFALILSCILLFYSEIKLKYVAITFLSALITVSDPISTYIFYVPLAAAILYANFSREGNNKNVFGDINKYGFFLFAGYLIGKLILHLVLTYGGFEVIGMPTQFIDLANIGSNIELFIQGILAIYDANFFGKKLYEFDSYHGVLLIFFIIVSFQFLSEQSKRKGVIFLEDFVAIVGGGIVFFSIVFSTLVTDITGLKYLKFFYLFSVAALLRFFWLSRNHFLKTFFLMYVGYLAVHVLPEHISSRRPVNTSKEIAKELCSNGLINGYADHWQAHIVNIYTECGSSVYPVVIRDGVMKPFLFLVNKEWYKANQVNFMIISKSVDSQNLFGVSPENVTNVLGKPIKVISHDKFEIWIWDTDISTKLAKF